MRFTIEPASALEARGDVTGALQHAMAIDDLARVGQVLRTTLARNMSMSDADVARSAIRSWLHEFGAQFVETNPKEVAEFFIGLISISGSDDAIWWLERLERAHPDPDRELEALIHGAWAELHLYNGESQNALRRSLAGLDAVDGRPPNKGLIPLIFSVVIRSYIQAGDLDEARTALERRNGVLVGQRPRRRDPISRSRVVHGRRSMETSAGRSNSLPTSSAAPT